MRVFPGKYSIIDVDWGEDQDLGTVELTGVIVN
jgi:hypothetical protein